MASFLQILNKNNFHFSFTVHELNAVYGTYWEKKNSSDGCYVVIIKRVPNRCTLCVPGKTSLLDMCGEI